MLLLGLLALLALFSEVLHMPVLVLLFSKLPVLIFTCSKFDVWVCIHARARALAEEKRVQSSICMPYRNK